MPKTTNEINYEVCHAITYSMLEEHSQRNINIMERDSEDKTYVRVLSWHKKNPGHRESVKDKHATMTISLPQLYYGENNGNCCLKKLKLLSKNLPTCYKLQ